jgi:hypothetical protein
VDLSQRRLIKVFATEVGLAPKLFGRLQRFQSAIALARRHRLARGEETLVEIARTYNVLEAQDAARSVLAGGCRAFARWPRPPGASAYDGPGGSIAGREKFSAGPVAPPPHTVCEIFTARGGAPQANPVVT